MKVGFREGCQSIRRGERSLASGPGTVTYRSGGTEKPEGQQCELSKHTDSREGEMSVM